MHGWGVGPGGATGTSATAGCLSLMVTPHRRPERSADSAWSAAGTDSDARALASEFAAFVDAYQGKIYNVIYRLVDDPQEAEDLTQDTFVSAFRAYHRFRGDASLYTWLYRIAINRTKNRLKQMARQRTAEAGSLDAPLEVGEDGISREVEDWTTAPARVAENRELGAYVQRCVRSLPPDFRSVVVLRDYEGLSYREIAAVEGCSVKAVKSRLFRARSVLRERIRRYLRADTP